MTYSLTILIVTVGGCIAAVCCWSCVGNEEDSITRTEGSNDSAV